MTNEIVPITDEQAKAIQEALKALQGLGGFVKETFGTVWPAWGRLSEG
jgi:hypothetical protein